MGELTMALPVFNLRRFFPVFASNPSGSHPGRPRKPGRPPSTTSRPTVRENNGNPPGLTGHRVERLQQPPLPLVVYAPENTAPKGPVLDVERRIHIIHVALLPPRKITKFGFLVV